MFTVGARVQLKKLFKINLNALSPSLCNYGLHKCPREYTQIQLCYLTFLIRIQGLWNYMIMYRITLSGGKIILLLCIQLKNFLKLYSYKLVSVFLWLLDCTFFFLFMFSFEPTLPSFWFPHQLMSWIKSLICDHFAFVWKSYILLREFCFDTWDQICFGNPDSSHLGSVEAYISNIYQPTRCTLLFL